ncbi:MAG: rubredoxin [Desulfobacter sp.]|nr:MAG: rubredoxin [Desulfobacter sp.]
MKKWQCSVCKYIHEGDTPPEKCPVCGVPASKFVLLEDKETPQEEPKASQKQEPAKSEPAKIVSDPEPEIEPEPIPHTPYEKLTHLMVKHHAHPVSVHMPNGILPAAAALFVLAWLFDYNLFVKAGFINLVFVILALPLVLFSGILEWQKKYNRALTPIFKIKILAATVTTTTCIVSLVWYLVDPNVTASPKAWVFILINLIMLGSAGVAGHIGGKLVFKD